MLIQKIYQQKLKRYLNKAQDEQENVYFRFLARL
jgi:hypothetical protein